MTPQKYLNAGPNAVAEILVALIDAAKAVQKALAEDAYLIAREHAETSRLLAQAVAALGVAVA